MSEAVVALISALAICVIFGSTAALVGGMVGLRTEPNRRLRMTFCGLITVGFIAAVWGTFFFQYRASYRIRVLGIPFPTTVYLLQGGEWTEVAWILHPGFVRGIDLLETVGVISAPASIPMIVRYFRRRRTRQRLLNGHCPMCDYDMRGGVGRCPECGSTVTSPKEKSGAFT